MVRAVARTGPVKKPVQTGNLTATRTTGKGNKTSKFELDSQIATRTLRRALRTCTILNDPGGASAERVLDVSESDNSALLSKGLLRQAEGHVRWGFLIKAPLAFSIATVS